MSPPPPTQLQAHIEHDAEQLAEYLASKDRLRDRLNAARTDMHAMRHTVSASRREFDAQLQYLREQVAPLLPAEHSVCKTPCAPPTTPAG